MERKIKPAAQYRKPNWEPRGAYGHSGTLYRPEFDALCFNLRLAFGGNATTIAKALGVGEQTLRGWLERYDSFKEAWDAGGLLADAAVARSFYKSATTGHKLVQQRPFYNAKQDRTVVVEYIERTPPNTMAQINWLSNRAPQLWRTMRSVTEITGADGDPLSQPLPPVIVVEAVWSKQQAQQLAEDDKQQTIEGQIWDDPAA